jgi:hypothetical protein
MSELKIINNQINADAATQIVLFDNNAINVTGASSSNRAVLINGNQISSSGNIYNYGINLNPEIKKITIAENNISGFNNVGIFVQHISSDGYSIITDNFISRNDGFNIYSFILGLLTINNSINNNSSAIITNNVLSHDTVDGFNWQSCIIGRGVGWVVERNINQTEEIAVDAWVGSKTFRQSPLTKYDVNYYFRNKVDVQGGVVKFIVDNSSSKENSLNVTLLTSNNTIFKKQAWTPHGPLQPLVFNGNAFQDSFGSEYVWTSGNSGALPSVADTTSTIPELNLARYLGDLDWIQINGQIGNTKGKFPHPFYTIKNYPGDVAPSTTGHFDVIVTSGPNLDRIADFISPSYLGGDNSLNNNIRPQRCRISGSPKNDGIYEIVSLSPQFSRTNFRFTVRRIVGYGINADPTGGNSLGSESINLSTESNEFIWSVNPEEILPSGAKVTYAKCTVNSLINNGDDLFNYQAPSGNVYLKVGGKEDSNSIANNSFNLELSGLSSKTPIRVVTNMVAINDYKEADVSGLTIRYKW